MAKSDPQFLQELEAESRKAGDDFLRGIASRLRREPLAPPSGHPYQGAPDFWQSRELSEDERIRQFMERWEQAGGHAVRVHDWSEAEQFVQKLIADTQARHLICEDEQELDALGLKARTDIELTVWNAEQMTEADKDELTTAAAGADIGIVQAEAAVTHTGTIMVSSSPRKGRSVSLLPSILVAVVPRSCIRRSLGEVLRPLDALSPDNRPAGVHFISGPSRSSDIENDLTIGVHGPGIVYAVILG